MMIYTLWIWGSSNNQFVGRYCAFTWLRKKVLKQQKVSSLLGYIRIPITVLYFNINRNIDDSNVRNLKKQKNGYTLRNFQNGGNVESMFPVRVSCIPWRCVSGTGQRSAVHPGNV